MPVLWVCPQLHAEPRSGGDLRSVRLLGALSARTVVSALVVGPCDHPDRLRAELGLTDLQVLARPSGAATNRLRAVVTGQPLQSTRVWNREAAARARGWQGHVVIDHPRMLPYARGHARFTVSFQNAEHDVLRQLPRPGSAFRRVERWWEERTLRRLELAAVARPGVLSVVVSEQDRQLLGSGVVVPNGADLPDRPTDVPPEGPPLFVGSLDYAPNLEAVRWWAESVWPLLEGARRPLQVVGRGGASALGALAAHESLEVIGEVPDVTPFLQGCRYVVVPLQQGGGSRLKVLEAMAHGRPVLSTTKGVEGIDLVPGEDVLLADAPADFSGAVEVLRDDLSRCRQLAARGRALAERFTWARIGNDFAERVLQHAQGDG